MDCMCVDSVKNFCGFEKLQELLGKGVVKTLLIVPLAKQDDEQPVLFVSEGDEKPAEVKADEVVPEALLLVQELQQRCQGCTIEEARCHYYECPESYLMDEILSWSRDTNRDYWLVLVEREPALRPRVHVQFHCQPPDIGWFSVALEGIEFQLKGAKPR